MAPLHIAYIWSASFVPMVAVAERGSTVTHKSIESSQYFDPRAAVVAIVQCPTKAFDGKLTRDLR